MNFRFIFTGSLVVLFTAIVAAPRANAAQPSPQADARHYEVSQRGADFKVMRSVRAAIDSAGRSANVTNRYTVIGNGMNKQDAAGNWTECMPVVQNFPGGIVCTGATYRVILKTNLNRMGSVDFETSDGERIISHPLAIAYFDPESGRRVWLSAMSDCRAQVLSNKVVYARAFTNGGIEAAVVYAYGVGRFHQDVVFTKKPATTPADLGMGSRTHLEVATEIMQAPVPVKQTRVLKAEKDAFVRSHMAEPDLVDETLAFTARMRMPQGYALPENSARTNFQRRVPVAKRLRTMVDGRTVLIEAVEWRDVRAELDKLPRRFVGTASPADGTIFAATLPASPANDAVSVSFDSQLQRAVKSGPVEMAAVTATAPKGFVLDYEMVDGSLTTLTAGTYFIPEAVTLGGLSYGSGVVMKFDVEASSGGPSLLTADSFTIATGYAGEPPVFTSMNDDSVGEVVDGSSGSPSTIPGTGLVFGGGDFGVGGTCRYLDVGLSRKPHSWWRWLAGTLRIAGRASCKMIAGI